jgi:hypothetical protein
VNHGTENMQHPFNNKSKFASSCITRHEPPPLLPFQAIVDHEAGYLQSRDLTDVYSTAEPQQAFHKRISFCLDVHNEAVRAMRFPATSYKDLQAPKKDGWVAFATPPSK